MHVSSNYTPENVSAHFVGVGGAGMSALANILLQRGAHISGSDLKLPLSRLKHAGFMFSQEQTILKIPLSYGG